MPVPRAVAFASVLQPLDLFFRDGQPCVKLADALVRRAEPRGELVPESLQPHLHAVDALVHPTDPVAGEEPERGKHRRHARVEYYGNGVHQIVSPLRVCRARRYLMTFASAACACAFVAVPASSAAITLSMAAARIFLSLI